MAEFKNYPPQALPPLIPNIFARSLIPVRPLLIARLFSLDLPTALAHPAALAYSSALAHTSTLTQSVVQRVEKLSRLVEYYFFYDYI